MMRRIGFVVLLGLCAAGSLGAQARSSLRTAVLYESYDFGAGLLIDRVTEFAVPVVLDLRLGRALGITLSGGYASVELTSTKPDELADQKVSGPLDTEVRLAFNVVPGRLILLGTGAIPSGTKSVAQDQLAILGALSSDIIGFSAANLGTGGSVGGGFAGALPLGRWALGYGGTYRQSLSYTPISGVPDELSPGGEVRVRGGLEGPLARRTYVRFAGIYAARAKDAINGAPRNGIGNRMIGYLALSQGLGPTQLILYGFDVFRGDPQLEPTATGAAVFPRGNLLALGGRWQFGGRGVSFTPRAEYRLSAIAAGTEDVTLRRAGETVRVGADLHLPLGSAVRFVVVGSFLTGKIMQPGEDVTLRGFRGGAHLVLRP